MVALWTAGFPEELQGDAHGLAHALLLAPSGARSRVSSLVLAGLKCQPEAAVEEALGGCVLFQRTWMHGGVVLWQLQDRQPGWRGHGFVTWGHGCVWGA